MVNKLPGKRERKQQQQGKIGKQSARIKRSKKLRAKLQKVELVRISISRSLK
jgi:hypothetical protein